MKQFDNSLKFGSYKKDILCMKIGIVVILKLKEEANQIDIHVVSPLP